jgi:heat shock protein HtpX
MASDYVTTKVMDWREQLARNQRRTFYVILMFIAIYAALGFFLDLYLTQSFMQSTLDAAWQQLIHLNRIPYATLTMGGVAALSILITFIWYDRLMLLGTEYYEITLETATSLEERQLYHIVEELKIAAGIHYTPKIYIIDADYMNAFASGYSEKSAMIAVTRGLLQKLDRSELQAVIAHELSHIRHGDIKLILTASILSNLMLITIDIFFYHAIYGRNYNRGGRRDKSDNNLIMIIILLRYILPILTVLLMLYLSRTREYMADAGSVELLRDNQPLARALIKINQDYQDHLDTYRMTYGHQKHENVRRPAYLFDPASVGIQALQSINNLFSTHPSLENRLKALGFKKTN